MSTSIARPYAQAIFELAKEGNAFDSWVEGLAVASLVAVDEDIAKLIADPAVSNEQLENLLIEVCGDKLPDGSEHFLRLLVQNGRVGCLPGIATLFAEMVDSERKSLTVEVVSAQRLTDSQRKNLVGALKTRLGRSVSLNESIDESLMGGAIVRAGDLVIDGSAVGKLQKLAGALSRQ